MRLVFERQYPKEHYPEDISTIVDTCAEAGYAISRNDALEAWLAYSDSMCAGWMRLPENENILSIMQQYCVETI